MSWWSPGHRMGREGMDRGVGWDDEEKSGFNAATGCGKMVLLLGYLRSKCCMVTACHRACMGHEKDIFEEYYYTLYVCVCNLSHTSYAYISMINKLPSYVKMTKITRLGSS